MSDKKVNETIEQQRKARAEFLKLKRMQKGELNPEPKPSEVAYAPKTFKEKVANFWFHYKFLTIAVIFLTAVFTFIVAQCATKVESDLEVIYFTYTPILDSEIVDMAEYFEDYAKDVNGDGKVKVNIINCSYSPTESTFDFRTSMLQKLQVSLIANPKALLVITDSESAKYFDTLKEDENVFFDKEFVSFSDKVSEDFKKSSYGEYLPQDMSISLVKIEGTSFEKQKDIKTYYKASKEFFEKITK